MVTVCRGICASVSETKRPAVWSPMRRPLSRRRPETMAAGFRRLGLIGLGLIGSSIALAARRAGVADEILGYARSPETRATVRRLGFCDRVCESAAEAVEGADCVVVCVPVGASGQVADTIAPALAPGAIVTDVGSVKASVVAAMASRLPAHVHFVPGHPLAGTEHSGPEAGFAELFDNRWTILTPLPEANAEATARLSAFWQALGARVAEMAPEHHDLVLAVTSHVPHAIAYTMVGVADDLARVTDSEVVQFSAAGFRDFTRIAASDPVMWRDVFLNNREATLDILGRFTEELYELRRAIRTNDGPWLEAYFTRTRAIRRSIIEAGQDTAAPDFGRGAAVTAAPDEPTLQAGAAAGGGADIGAGSTRRAGG
ncbi:MAG: prephenate/arogenate dehydrogenase family protein [Pseudomonadota bacterium]